MSDSQNFIHSVHFGNFKWYFPNKQNCHSRHFLFVNRKIHLGQIQSFVALKYQKYEQGNFHRQSTAASRLSFQEHRSQHGLFFSRTINSAHIFYSWVIACNWSHYCLSNTEGKLWMNFGWKTEQNVGIVDAHWSMFHNVICYCNSLI